MRKLLFWLLMVFTVVCCVSPIHDNDLDIVDTAPVGSIEKYKIVIHDTVPADKVAGITDAAAEWVKTTDGRVTYEITFGHFDTTGKPSIGEVWVFLGTPDPNGHTIGYCTWWNTDPNGHPGRARIWIDSTLNEHTNFLVALHELGHSLGLHHSDDANQPSIMIHVITDVGEKPTCYDHQTVCQLWNCDQTCPQ
jgi:hypothetical protein